MIGTNCNCSFFRLTRESLIRCPIEANCSRIEAAITDGRPSHYPTIFPEYLDSKLAFRHGPSASTVVDYLEFPSQRCHQKFQST